MSPNKDEVQLPNVDGSEANKVSAAKALDEAKARIEFLEKDNADIEKLIALQAGGGGGGNTSGKVAGDVPKAAAKANAANPPKDDKNLLEGWQEGAKGFVDDWVEKQGDSKLAMAAGALSQAVIEVFMPTQYWELIPMGKLGKILKKGAEVSGLLKKGEKAAEVITDVAKGEKEIEHAKDAERGVEAGKDATRTGEAAGDARKAEKEGAEAGGGGNDSQVKKRKKRKPKRRCELVPYDELECDEGQDAHHVVPDWMLRLGKRGGTERIPEMPDLSKGPAICLERGSGNEHNTAHKHTDRPAQRIGKSGTRTGTPGTISLGNAKKVSSRAIEKATGGKGKGGCSKADIQKQLDEQFKAHNDTLLRAVKDARKVTDEIRNILNGGKD